MFYSLYSNFILNFFIDYELNIWPRNPTNNFTLKNCFFGTVKLTRNAGKSKFTYNIRDVVFDGKGCWSFDNNTARNNVIFGVDISSSSHIDNLKNNCLELGEGPTKGINGNFGTAEEK